MKRKHFKGLYDSRFETDSCGNGMIAHIKGIASRKLLDIAIESLRNMSHRGAKAADGKSGDGCGVLLGLPIDFFKQKADELSIKLSESWTVGSVFFPQDEKLYATILAAFKKVLARHSLALLGIREVPINPSVLGEHAQWTMPKIEQVYIADLALKSGSFLNRLYCARREIEAKFEEHREEFFICTLHPKLISYKGLVIPDNLAIFYPDLEHKLLQTNVCVYHQRFATNTLPQWRLAQPYRHLAHNGEINTISGNRNSINVKSQLMVTPNLTDSINQLPLTSRFDSDSLSLDNAVELFMVAGTDIAKTARLLSPPAWRNEHNISAEQMNMFEYDSFVMEPWDGPASLMITDGEKAVCTTDRNGLRPVRYVETYNGFINLASETGVYEFPLEQIKNKGRLGPGDILCVNLSNGHIEKRHELDERLAREHDYSKWVKNHVTRLESTYFDTDQSIEGVSDLIDSKNIPEAMAYFNITREEVSQILLPLGQNGAEGVGSMGDDIPIAALSKKRRSLYDYFRQSFAQVTNPPIDSLREQSGMSLVTALGALSNPLQYNANQARKIVLGSPILSRTRYKKLFDIPDYNYTIINLEYDKSDTIEKALDDVILKVETAVRNGCELIVLQEIIPPPGKVLIHCLLALGAVHHALCKSGLRTSTSLIVTTGTARDTHQIACLLATGANAVYPWLAYSMMNHLTDEYYLADFTGRILRNYRKGINKGLLKIMSKMGISTIASYRGAQLYQILGLGEEICAKCFGELRSPIAGASWLDIEEQNRGMIDSITGPINIEIGGVLKYVHNGEQHSFNPDVVEGLQKVAQSGSKQDWENFAEHVNHRPAMCVRDLFRIIPAEHPTELSSVEPRDKILKRFDSAGMSLGALSPEAHQDLAKAMNSMGARSNSGEGGEDPARFNSEANSKIKQVASGRFGVTPEYLQSAEVIQIKVAQGAKPGEGGQLPGRKVNSLIARLRYSVPGVTLISPPPHHDIYSIEDLAQLIFDLKEINEKALVSVKLVSSLGVGTIAAGVVKAGADLITISGQDGGTAASPLSSIRYAGLPFEIGLAETQQALVYNDLRSRIILQADGGLKSGLDVIKAAILGADSFGFGTGPMVALGCKYLRICHLNNCATGIATQHFRLRDKYYHGQVAKVRNYFSLLAEEVRKYLSILGEQSIEDIIGKVELMREVDAIQYDHQHLDLELLQKVPEVPIGGSLRFVQSKEREPKNQLTAQMLQDVREQVKNDSVQTKNYQYSIRNVDRTIGAAIASMIARKNGNKGLSNELKIGFNGTAGQSFGAFNLPGMNLKLTGDCNDYVGKGMAGGEIVIVPNARLTQQTDALPILGNTCLYGATAGKLFASGQAGERFAVRNSGAIAVIEGAGQHCCEYMTGGEIVVLGSVGNNFAAGMTGGLAYVYDTENLFVDQCNKEMVEMHRITSEETEDHRYHLRGLIREHHERTSSVYSKRILDNFDQASRSFWLVLPRAISVENLMKNTGRDAA